MQVSPPDSEVFPGALLAGKYLVGKELGRGANGTVYEALHQQLHQRVAVKVLRRDPKDEAKRARMLREARIAATLRSDHSVRIIDVIELPSGIPCIVMEHLDGCSLADKLRADGPLPLQLAVELMSQACEALSEAHAQGLVHRDLKPANLFLTKTPRGKVRLKVVDFGLAKSVRGSESDDEFISQSEAVVGSPAYMSPEQVRASKTVDARTDVWALGVVLQQLTSGRLPFDGTNGAAVLAAIAADPPRLLSQDLPDAPFELQRIVDKCLRKRRDERYRRVDDLARDLNSLLAQLGRSAPDRLPPSVEPGAGTETQQSMTTAAQGTSGWESSRRARWFLRFVAAAVAMVAIALIPPESDFEGSDEPGSAVADPVVQPPEPSVVTEPAGSGRLDAPRGGSSAAEARQSSSGSSPERATEGSPSEAVSRRESPDPGPVESAPARAKRAARSVRSNVPAPAVQTSADEAVPWRPGAGPDPLDRQW